MLEKLATEPSYYFLRSAHAVSGVCRKLPKEFATPEGQMFNADCELRWKKRKLGYDVLLLSRVEVGLEGMKQDFSNWEICDFDAYLYKNEPKFPNSFIFKGLNDEDINLDGIIAQRYFKDADTATVHFIALTVKEK
ncbi:MAG: hypothetical protein PUP92_29130 [Rhizonema sp. PD38]|nr:hypothetical protein [Rhizonema sp. PD38]